MFASIHFTDRSFWPQYKTDQLHSSPAGYPLHPYIYIVSGLVWVVYWYRGCVPGVPQLEGLDGQHDRLQAAAATLYIHNHLHFTKIRAKSKENKLILRRKTY